MKITRKTQTIEVESRIWKELMKIKIETGQKMSEIVGDLLLIRKKGGKN